MRIKLMPVLLALFLILGFSASSVQAYQPQRVAILPLTSLAIQHDSDMEKVVANAVEARFHMPLAQTITIFDIIPPDRIRAALPHSRQDRGKPGQPDEQTLRELAARLDADIVIGAQITRFAASTYTAGFEGDWMQQTDLSVRIVGYSRQDGKFLDIADSESYLGEWSTLGDADYLAGKIMDRLMKRVPFTFRQPL